MALTATSVLDEIDQLPLNQAVAKGLRVAEAAGEKEIAKWCRLELAGYWGSNSAMTDDVVVPEYRAVIGQHADIYGRVFMVPNDLSFVNETRLRNGIEELEALAQTRDTVAIHDPEMCRLIAQHMKVDVYSFRFSAVLLTGIFSAIREELRRKLAALEPIAGVAIAAANHKGSKEILQLKPNLWGVGVDLRAMWSRLKGMR